MKKLIAATALVAFAVPAAALGKPHHSSTSAQAQCRAELKAMGKQTFRDTYGTNKGKRNAFGKCVSHRNAKNAKAESAAATNAAKACKAERTADPAAFQAKYGTGKKGKNAYGKCVSQAAKAKAKATEAKQVKAEVSAAKACKAERTADPAAFKVKYGTNKRRSNAFGKCVSTQAKAKAKS